MNNALARITGWLLSNPVLRSSPSGGLGVVNWLVPGAPPEADYDGLYPEIGGYYLQFLAPAASDPHRPGGVEPTIARQTAVRVVAWLDEAPSPRDPPR